MMFGDLNLGIDEFFVGRTSDSAEVFMIQYDKEKGNTREKYLILLIKSMSKIILMMCYYHIIKGDIIRDMFQV